MSVFAKDLDVNPLVSCDLSVWSLDFLPVSVWVLTSYSSFGPKSKHTDRLGQMAITSRSAGQTERPRGVSEVDPGADRGEEVIRRSGDT